MFRFVLILCPVLLAAAEPDIRGFPADALRQQRTWEEKARASIQPERLREYLRRLSSRPHSAGSPGARSVVDYLAGLLRSWNYDVRIEEFEVLLPTPTERILELVAPHKFRAALKEPPVAADKDTADATQLPTFNAFSPSGDVTAPLVYVNYGLPDDYAWLKAQGIDVKGKIVLARYGATWRGLKPKLAFEHGAVGCLIYSDPRDDGYYLGDAFPRGPYRPPDGVQRGSVLDGTSFPGDPFTPGWPAEKGARRLSLAEAATLPKIPVLPISSNDARPLLRSLHGPLAPESWRGALPLTYHVGPGPARVHLRLAFDWAPRSLYNVIAVLGGSRFPDQWIIYGNHHDAWVNGASDPSSGASALLETARSLAELRRQGWKPGRTILFALWDGEEFGLLGSTEWIEKHASELQRSAVAYLNSDSTGKGRLHAGGSHLLETFLAEVARDVPDPATGKSLWQKEYRLSALGAGSDYTPFLHHLGVATLNLGFSDPGARGIYHSIYDDFYWYEHFSDSRFVYGRALAQLMSTALVRLADAPLLPFDAAGLARAIADYLLELEKSDRRRQVSFNELRLELDRLKRNAVACDARYRRALPRLSTMPDARLAAVNDRLFQLERALAPAKGLPSRPWYRHRIYAPGRFSGYGAETLPGIREALDAQNWEEANRQCAELAAVLRTLNAQLRDLEKLLAQ